MSQLGQTPFIPFIMYLNMYYFTLDAKKYFKTIVKN